MPSIGRRALQLLGFCLYAAVTAIVIAEIGARVLSTERDGRLIFLGVTQVPVPPVPVSHRVLLTTPVDELPYIVPDPDLGWTIKPDGRTQDGLFASNNLGLRSAPTPTQTRKTPGTVRVLLVGDSYTHGDEVPWADTWAQRLQEELGPDFEILNGGVAGYGTDQAVLRGRRLRAELAPDVVVLGIYRQDLLRNLTLFRTVKHPWTSFPWSKPRFVPDGDGLALVNHPVVPPERVVATLEGFAASALVAHDRLWDPALHADSAWYGSRLWRHVRSLQIHHARAAELARLTRDRNEGVVVTARLARLFVEETTAAGARAVIVLLPGVDELPGYRDGATSALAPLHAELQRLSVARVDMGPPLLAALGDDESVGALFVGGTGHPNARANRVIARALVPHLR